MPRVYVGAGSNVDPEANLRAALDELRRSYGDLSVSTVYRSRAVGFAGPDFLNLVVAFETEDSPAEVDRRLHAIETGLGRVRDGPRFGSRTIDLDLLLYGDLVARDGALVLPRPEMLEHPFVLWPLAELAGDRRHPVLGRTFAELKRELHVAPEAMEPVVIEGIERPPARRA